MKISAKKNNKKKVDSKARMLHVVEKSKVFLGVHGVFLMCLLAGVSIGFALYKGKTYLSPSRDEAKYQELSSKTYSKIDYNLVTKLSQALSDQDVTISQNKDPNRSNPFSE